jgi:hypothetical protein
MTYFVDPNFKPHGDLKLNERNVRSLMLPFAVIRTIFNRCLIDAGVRC